MKIEEFLVKAKKYIDTQITDYLTQVFLLAGGLSSNGFLSSTEVYEGGRWTEVGALPEVVRGLSGASLQNIVYMMGKRDLMTGVLLIIHS